METKIGVFLVDPESGQVLMHGAYDSLPEAIEDMAGTPADAWFHLPIHVPLPEKEAPAPVERKSLKKKPKAS